ncbi:MAG: hypothetical protein AAB532_02155 [Patescibacteria group bacterium]
MGGFFMEKLIKLLSLSIGEEIRAVVLFVLTTALIGFFVNIITAIFLKLLLDW